MKNLFAVCLVLGMSLPFLAIPLFAIEDGQTQYVGGTAPAVTAGDIGKLDLTSDKALVFEHGGAKLTIAYADIESYQYSQEVTHHLGVLPAIAVGLLKKRQRSHYFRISYRDGNVSQVAVFEVPKQMPRTLQAVLQARVPRRCQAPACSSPLSGQSSQPLN